MNIQIKEVKTRDELYQFIHLTEKIHAKHNEWIHPLLMDEWALFSPNKNPAFEHCTTIQLLAIANNEVVGRIMGIIHHHYNKANNENNARFCFIETYDNFEVFSILINSVTTWAKTNGCNKLIGPLGFSDKEPQGFLFEGFDKPTVMLTNCSFPYMVSFIERMGFEPQLDLVQYKLTLSDQLEDRLKPFATRCQQQNKVILHEFKSTRKIKPYIRPVFALINETYQDIYGFSPISTHEADVFANRYLPLLNPRMIKVVTDQSNNVISFVVAMPDYAKGVKKARGRLFPFGWFHIFRSMKKSEQIVLLLGAIEKSMRNKGLDALMGLSLINSARNLGFKYIDSHLIMAKNYKMRREMERLDGAKLYKKYRIFQKDI